MALLQLTACQVDLTTGLRLLETLLVIGDHAAFDEVFDEVLRAAVQVPMAESLARTYQADSQVTRGSRAWRDAAAKARTALRRSPIPEIEAHLGQTEARGYLAEGDASSAIVVARKALDAVVDLPTPSWIRRVRGTLATALVEGRDVGAFRRVERRAMATSE